MGGVFDAVGDAVGSVFDAGSDIVSAGTDLFSGDFDSFGSDIGNFFMDGLSGIGNIAGDILGSPLMTGILGNMIFPGFGSLANMGLDMFAGPWGNDQWGNSGMYSITANDGSIFQFSRNSPYSVSDALEATYQYDMGAMYP